MSKNYEIHAAPFILNGFQNISTLLKNKINNSIKIEFHSNYPQLK